jgi:homoserine kinase
MGGFVVCTGATATRFDIPAGLEALVVVPSEPVATAEARAVLPEQVPLADAVFNVAHASLLTLGLARGEWDLVARGLHDRLHEPHRAHLYPRSVELAQRAREVGALGATISGAGPTVLVWTHYEQTAGVFEGLRRAAGGDAQVVRVPFETQGAEVRAL